jgi:hypothetical protein
MAEPPDIFPYPAKFVPSQKGTQLLQDCENFTYRIHEKNIKNNTANYRCTKKIAAKCPAVAVLDLGSSQIVKILHHHSHTSNQLREVALQEERRMIAAATAVGRVSTVEILSKIKTNLERSENPEAVSSIRKSRAIAQAICREKRKSLGHNSTIPTSAAEIKENLPPKFSTTSTGAPFMRYCDFVDADQTKLMMLFMSDHGGWVLSRSTDIFADGTFDTSPDPFAQIYFILGQMGPHKRAIPCVFALLPDKEATTYLKMWTTINNMVKFQDGLPQRVMSDFEKGVMNSVAKTLPHAQVRGCNFHHKQAIRRNLQEKGLVTVLNKNTKFEYLIKMIYGLAFVPPDSVSEVFSTVIQDYVTENKEEPVFMEFEEEIDDFLSYFERYRYVYFYL